MRNIQKSFSLVYPNPTDLTLTRTYQQMLVVGAETTQSNEALVILVLHPSACCYHRGNNVPFILWSQIATMEMYYSLEVTELTDKFVVDNYAEIILITNCDRD